MTAGTEGTLPFRGHQIYYRVVGDLAATGARVPVLVLHGGPGMPHDYLSDFAGLAHAGRTVVFYNQLGCGRSDHPEDPDLWRMATFVDELKMVRAALDLREMHLLGHERSSIVTRRTQPPMIPSTCSLSASTTRPTCAESNLCPSNLAGWDVTDRLRELDLPVLSPQVATTR